MRVKQWWCSARYIVFSKCICVVDQQSCCHALTLRLPILVFCCRGCPEQTFCEKQAQPCTMLKVHKTSQVTKNLVRKLSVLFIWCKAGSVRARARSVDLNMAVVAQCAHASTLTQMHLHLPITFRRLDGGQDGNRGCCIRKLLPAASSLIVGHLVSLSVHQAAFAKLLPSGSSRCMTVGCKRRGFSIPYSEILHCERDSQDKVHA